MHIIKGLDSFTLTDKARVERETVLDLIPFPVAFFKEY